MAISSASGVARPQTERRVGCAAQHGRRPQRKRDPLGCSHFLRRDGQCLLFSTPKLETLSSSASPA